MGSSMGPMDLTLLPMLPEPLLCTYLGDPRPALCGAKEVVSNVAEASTSPRVATLVAQLLDGPPDTCAISVLGEWELHPGECRGTM